MLKKVIIYFKILKYILMLEDNTENDSFNGLTSLDMY